MIGRRRFLQIAGAGSYAFASRARAQAPEIVKRYGLLFQASPGTKAPASPPPFIVEALRQRGWVVGRNLILDIRFWERPDQLPGILQEFIEAKVDLIAAHNTPAARAAQAATTTIPIVFEVGSDPVATKLVASLSRPGGNLTGFVNGLLEEKLLEIFKEAVPKAKRVVIPFAKPSDAFLRAAKELRVEVIGVSVTDAAGLDEFFQAMKKMRPDGVVVPNEAWMNFAARQLAQGMKDAALPAIAWSEEFARSGGLLSYQAESMFERRMAVVDALLRGASPRDIPVEMPTKFRLIVNLVTAKALGLTIPQKVLLRAHEDDVIRS